MNQSTAIILLILTFVVIYYLIQFNSKSKTEDVEKFVALSGIQDPLTTYDDYGIFNGIYQMNDFPYYDHTYEDLFYRLKEKKPTYMKDPGSILLPRNNIEDFDTDHYIFFDGKRVRRELVPYNYTDNPHFADADFDQRTQNYILVNPARERRSSVPPWPSNVYFAK